MTDSTYVYPFELYISTCMVIILIKHQIFKEKGHLICSQLKTKGNPHC